MELEIKSDGEITLPDWIGSSTLTLAEIGAVAVLSCLEADGGNQRLADRIGSPEMAEAMSGLKEKGVLKAQKDSNSVAIVVDLDPVFME